jgi:hypothetical protein
MKVIVNSLPKSGTHVISRILDLSGFSQNKVNFDASLLRRTSRNTIKNLVKWYKQDRQGQGYWIDLDLDKRNIKERFFVNLISNFKENSYSMAHLPFSEKIELCLKKNKVKVIYIIRDPRDVAVSHFYHHLKDDKYQGYKLMNNLKDHKQRLMLSMKGFRHNSEYATSALRERIDNSKGWFFSCSNNILPIKFEDIIGVQGGGSDFRQKEVLLTIEKFLGLKKNHLVNQKDKIFYKKSETFRKGCISDWIGHFDNESKEYIKKELGEVIVELGYESDYDW